MTNKTVKFPKNIDLDAIFYFVEMLKDQEDEYAKFWKGEDMPGDGIETVFSRTQNADTIIGTIDVTNEMEQLVSWLRTLPTHVVESTDK